VCPWPDCNVPADRCQVHHIDAHKHGGHTKPSNLTMLCKYHNGVNDDDGPCKKRKRQSPGKPTRGRMRRHRGKVRLQTPGGRLVGSTQDLSSMGAMDLISVPPTSASTPMKQVCLKDAAHLLISHAQSRKV